MPRLKKRELCGEDILARGGGTMNRNTSRSGKKKKKKGEVPLPDGNRKLHEIMGPIGGRREKQKATKRSITTSKGHGK